MDPKQFVAEIVEPNIAELNAKYDDLRLAFNALAAVDALAARIFHWAKENNPSSVSESDDSAYRATLAKKDNDFALVRDMAKASKHAKLTRYSPQVTDAAKIQTKSLGWGQATWGEGRFGSPPHVVIEIDGAGGAKSYRVVETLLKSALDLLRAEMKRVGIPD